MLGSGLNQRQMQLKSFATMGRVYRLRHPLATSDFCTDNAATTATTPATPSPKVILIRTNVTEQLVVALHAKALSNIHLCVDSFDAGLLSLPVALAVMLHNVGVCCGFDCTV